MTDKELNKDNFSGAKKLPRDPEGGIIGKFKANNKDYYIRTPEECITIERWTVYENLSIMYGFDRTLSTIANKIKTTKDDLNAILRGNNEKNVIEIIQDLQTLLDGMVRRNKAKYNVALYICTLFIVSKDEDISDWDYAHAKDKIQDWVKEGYSVEDFFYLARTMQGDFIRVLQKQLDL